MTKVLFVCLGNICRSPTGEAVFKKMLESAGLQHKVDVDSCGTSANHAGEPADVRMRTHASERGYDLTSVARGLTAADLKTFDFVLAMDDQNFADIQALDKDGSSKEKIFKMTSFCKDKPVKDVPDPYYGGPDGFETVLDILEDACTGLLAEVRKKEFESESERI